VVISIDTTSAQVARAALDAGAGMVNDISAGRHDPQMLPLAAARQIPVILMHMKGTPATMQADPVYQDVVAEVRRFLDERRAAAVAQGVAEGNILLDPGIGFGKTLDHNLELLRRQQALVELGRPLVVGTSRKRFIGTITGESEPARRVFGTAATVAWAVTNGAAVVRVHDVGAMAQVVRMIRAIQHGAAE
jgi:dihydropteroate synthase